MVRVGFVRKPVGLAGDLRTDSLTDDASRFRPGSVLVAGGREYTVASAKVAGDDVTLRLEGVDSLDAADRLRGQYLEVPAARVRSLEPGNYYHWQLVGLRVTDLDGTELGVLSDVLEYPANDIYVVEGAAGEILVPALESVVREVDLSAGRMLVALPPTEVVQP